MRWIGALAGALLGMMLVPGLSLAQAQNITIDGTLPGSKAGPLTGPNYDINAGLGNQVGGNLFHSFGKFGLEKNESANFSSTGPVAVTNVIGRVTGGARSEIHGAININSSIPRADLYLINPAGMVFGPTATVNVSGAFHASTADYIRMSDGVRFQATTNSSTLSSAPPAAFGFLNASPATITVNGSKLAAPTMLSMVGRGSRESPLTITNSDTSTASLSAPGGTIHVTAVASAGEVPVDPANTAAFTVTKLAPVKISGSAKLDVGNAAIGGSVFINASELTISASEINADNNGPDPGGRIALRGDDQLTLSGARVSGAALSTGSGANISVVGGSVLFDAGTITQANDFGAAGYITVRANNSLTVQSGGGVFSTTTGPANASDIAITVAAGDLRLSNAGQISTRTSGAGSDAGKAGTVSVNVAGRLWIDGVNSAISSLTSGKGAAGSVTVVADTLSLTKLGQISTNTSGAGKAGSVVVETAGLLSIDGFDIVGRETVSSGIFSRALPGPDSSGDAGTVRVKAGEVSITNFGTISASAFGTGSAGEVSVGVTGLLSLNQGTISSQGGEASSNAGKVTVLSRSLVITNGGRISSRNGGDGSGGKINVEVAEALVIDGLETLSQIIPTGILADAKFPGSGDAGTINVKAGSLSISGNGVISSASRSGAAGSVKVVVDGDLIIRGTKSDAFTGISSESLLRESGNAGDVTVLARSLRITDGGQISTSTFGQGNAGTVSVTIAGALAIDGPNSGIISTSQPKNTLGGAAGTVTVSAGAISLTNGAAISTSTGGGRGGDVRIAVAGDMNITAGAQVAAETTGSGNAGNVTIDAGLLSVTNAGRISTKTEGKGLGGDIRITTADSVTLSVGARIVASTSAAGDDGGDAGSVTVNAPQIAISSGAQIASTTAGGGNAGAIAVTATGGLTIDGQNLGIDTGINSQALKGSTGTAGTVTVVAGNMSITSGGGIATGTSGSGKGGDLSVGVTGTLTIDGSNTTELTAIQALARGSGDAGTVSGDAGTVNVTAGNVIIRGGGFISASTITGTGQGGSVSVAVSGALIIDGSGSLKDRTGITSNTRLGSSGNAGPVTVSAGSISIINSGAEITSSTYGEGAAGNVTVATTGALFIDGSGTGEFFTGVKSDAITGSKGPAGQVTVSAGSISIINGGGISTSTFGTGIAGHLEVTVAGALTIDGANATAPSAISSQANAGSNADAGFVTVSAGSISMTNGAMISTSTAGAGQGGNVFVSTSGDMSVTGGSQITAATASGNAGSVSVDASQITLLSGAQIASTTSGTGAGGSVFVTTSGALVLDGMGVSGTQIAASATGLQSGEGGLVTVSAASLVVQGGGQIASTAGGLGRGGNIAVTIAGDVVLSGTASDGSASGITASAPVVGSSGGAGLVVLRAGGSLSLSSGAEVSSATAGSGNGGMVTVSAQGPLTLSGGSAIVASASPDASGDAGSVSVSASQISVSSGAQIASTTAGTGKGGSVMVTTPGSLVIDGLGMSGTQIAASATGVQSGAGGSVTVEAALLVVQGGGQIASTAAGSGAGGDIRISVGSDIVLSGTGPQITAFSSGIGDAGSIIITANTVRMSGGAAISTEATRADGGNITLHVSKLLRLTDSEITTSATNSGGNITIDPDLVILERSRIIARAQEGRGGNITIVADLYVQSWDSIVDASSKTGISGNIEINAPRVDLNGSLVALVSELRGAADVLRTSCAARSTLPQSSLTEAGRGGLPQDPDSSIPALYLAGYDAEPVRLGAAAVPAHLQVHVDGAHSTLRCR